MSSKKFWSPNRIDWRAGVVVLNVPDFVLYAAPKSAEGSVVRILDLFYSSCKGRWLKALFLDDRKGFRGG